MEIEEVKKITRYDEYTINEFVRSLVDTREKVAEIRNNIANRVDELNRELGNLQQLLEQDDVDQSVVERIEIVSGELDNARQEKEKIEQTLKNWEAEKERIKSHLESKKQETENKIQENEAKIENFSNEIRENESRMEELEPESDEYKELEKANNLISKKISRTRGIITRYEKKINNLIEISGNLDKENVLEGLKPPRTIAKARTRSGISTRTKAEPTKEPEVKAEPAKTEPAKAEPAKTEPAKAKPAKVEPAKTEPAKAKPAKAEPAKTEPAKAEPAKAKPAKAEPAKAESAKVESKAEPAKAEPKDGPKVELKWHPKLTQEQIEELISEGLEPGDNEYDMYLLNHGINPFEKVEPKVDQAKSGQKTYIKLEWHPKLTKEQIEKAIVEEGIWHPAGPEYEQFLRDNGITDSESKEPVKAKIDEQLIKENEEAEKEAAAQDEKQDEKKVSFLKRVTEGIKNFWNNIKQRISNSTKARLPEGTEVEETEHKTEVETSARDKFAAQIKYNVAEQEIDDSKHENIFASLGREAKETYGGMGESVRGLFSSKSKMEKEMLEQSKKFSTGPRVAEDDDREP